jgi:hypothetical protein
VFVNVPYFPKKGGMKKGEEEFFSNQYLSIKKRKEDRNE